MQEQMTQAQRLMELSAARREYDETVQAIEELLAGGSITEDTAERERMDAQAALDKAKKMFQPVEHSAQPGEKQRESAQRAAEQGIPNRSSRKIKTAYGGSSVIMQRGGDKRNGDGGASSWIQKKPVTVTFLKKQGGPPAPQEEWSDVTEYEEVAGDLSRGPHTGRVLPGGGTMEKSMHVSGAESPNRIVMRTRRRNAARRRMTDVSSDDMEAKFSGPGGTLAASSPTGLQHQAAEASLRAAAERAPSDMLFASMTPIVDKGSQLLNTGVYAPQEADLVQMFGAASPRNVDASSEQGLMSRSGARKRRIVEEPPASQDSVDEVADDDKLVQIRKFTSARQFAKRDSVAVDHGGPAWKRNRDEVDRRGIVANRWASLFAILGLACAVMQNEYLMQGEPVTSTFMNILKCLNSLFTLIAMAFIYRVYQLHVLFERIVLHLTRRHGLNTRVGPRDVLGRVAFWIEFVSLAVHLPPFFTGAVSSEWQDNFMLHQLETTFAVWNTGRLYLVARCVADITLLRLPKRHTIATFSGVPIGYSFAFKRIFSDIAAGLFLSLMWGVLLLVIAYWYRASEVTACTLTAALPDPRCDAVGARVWSLDGVSTFTKVNDLYMWNAVWAAFMTTTTVGYGDEVPSTLFSRSCASLAAIIGIIIAALLTASLQKSLTWTPGELSALLVLERERSKLDLRDKAASFLQLWWRIKQGRAMSSRQRRQDTRDMAIDFRVIKEKTLQEVEDLSADSLKISQIAVRCKLMEAASNSIIDRIFAVDVVDEIANNQKDFAGGDDHVSGAQKLHLASMAQDSSFSKRINASLDGIDAPIGNHGVLHDDEAEQLQLTIERMKQQVDALKAACPGHSDWSTHFPWRRNRGLLDRMIFRTSAMAALCAIVGTLFAMMQNELVFSDVPVHDARIEACKAGNSICTIVLLHLLYRYHWLRTLFDRLQQHLQRGVDYDTDVSWRDVMGEKLLWIEWFVCALHLPPFATFELAINNLDYIVAYRGETIVCLFNTLRVYLVWRILAEWVLSHLPKRHTVSLFASVKLGKTFALKKLLNGWHSIIYIIVLWGFSILFLAYWLRCAEVTSCLFKSATHPSCLLAGAKTWILGEIKFEKVNDTSTFSGIWLTFVTSTGVGYGDLIPTTHLSRLVCVISAIIGIISSSLLTAALSNSIHFSSAELSATMLLKREQARIDLEHLAADMIQIWWRTLVARHLGINKLSKKQERSDPYDLVTRFRQAKVRSLLDIDDCAGTSSKIEAIAQKTKFACRGIDAMVDKLWEVDLLEAAADIGGRNSIESESTPRPLKSLVKRARRNSFVDEAIRTLDSAIAKKKQNMAAAGVDEVTPGEA